MDKNNFKVRKTEISPFGYKQVEIEIFNPTKPGSQFGSEAAIEFFNSNPEINTIFLYTTLIHEGYFYYASFYRDDFNLGR